MIRFVHAIKIGETGLIATLHSKTIKIIFVAILLASLSPAFGGQRFVHAQNGGVTLSAAAGFDGYCKDKRWLPVRVEVENTGPDLDASVQVSYQNSSGGITSTTTEAQLPTSSRKAFFVYIFADGSLRDFTVSLFDGKKVLQKVKLSANCLADTLLLVGVISDTPAAFDGLSDINPLGGTSRVAQLRIDDLPERYQAWRTLDALVVSNADTGVLTAAQKQAMELWLSSGGKLFVAGGAQWQRTTAGLNELLPVEIRSTRNVTDLTNLSAYVEDESPLSSQTTLAVGTMREGARALVEEEGVSILSQKNVGFGEVYYLAADPSANPLVGWAGMKTLYEQSLATRPPLPPWAISTFDSSGYSNPAEQALGAMKELSMPSILYICGLLGLYVVVMGPLNFLVLRRTKRRELAWMTIPALVIIFSCVFYATGFSFRGFTPIMNRLMVAQAWDGVPQANVKALVGVYSPVRAGYDVTAAEGFMPRAFSGSFGDLQADNQWAVLQQDDSMTLPDTRVEIAGMKALILEGSLPALPISHTLTIDLGKTPSSVTGTVTNASEFTLKDAMLITPGGWKELGDLKPGASTDVNLFLTSSSSSFYSSNAGNILNINPIAIQPDVEAARQYSFLQAVLSSSDYSYMNAGNWGVYLIGWMDRSDLPVGIDGRRYDRVDTVLYIHSLTPQLKTEGSVLNLPSGFFAWESSSPLVSPYSAFEIPDEGYILRFKPAMPIQFRSVQSLKLMLVSSNPSALTAYAWNFETGSWTRLATDKMTITISNPDQFVAPNGEARIRVVQDQSTYTEITSTTITMQVIP